MFPLKRFFKLSEEKRKERKYLVFYLTWPALDDYL